ncbi:MAG: UDP-N-acetylmuramoyl-tripeptide--D-alanyl-D-alanine ligase [Bacteroidota bacterium]
MKEPEEFIQKLINKGYSICTDSRLANNNNLFFALKGDNFNGNDFAIDALNKGCEYAFVDKKINTDKKGIIYVKNVLSLLHKVAKNHRQQFSIPLIAITGSNGKTTTKELISKVLSEKFNVLYTKGNLNNHIGVPLSLLKLNQSHEIAVIEIGANQPGEIKMLSEIACPTHAIITNIGKAHLEGFNNLETIKNNKAALYHYIIKNKGIIFQNGDNQILKDISGNYSNIITYGKNTKNDLQGDLQKQTPYLTISYSANKAFGKCKGNINSIIETALTGNYNFENVLAAVSVGLYFGVEPELIKKAIKSYVPDNSRSQIIKTKDNLILLDAYNANPTSMMASLESFLSFGKEPKSLILGDMLEMGEYAKNEHKIILNWINKHRFHKVILIGSEFLSFKNIFSNYHYFKDAKSASQWIENNPINNNTILIKGSRGIKLESVLNSIS